MKSFHQAHNASRFAFFLAIFFSSVASGWAAVPTYHMIPLAGLPSLVPASNPSAVNELGQVAGDAVRFDGNTYVGQRAATWSTPDDVHDLGTLLANDSVGVAEDINGHGATAGWAYDTRVELSGVTQSAVWWAPDATTPTRLPMLPGPEDYSSNAFGINDAGVIVGTSWRVGNVPLRWETPTSTPVKLASSSYQGVTVLGELALAINNSGQVVGTGVTPPPLFGGAGEQRAMAWESDGTPHVLTSVPNTPLGGAYSAARDISDSGIIAGYGGTFAPDGSFLHLSGLRWDSIGAAPQVLDYFDTGTAGDSLNYADAVNSAGFVTGWAYRYVQGNIIDTQAVLWDAAGRAYNLNSLVENLNGYTLIRAQGINDSGFIVANTITPEGYARAVLLKPVPEPSACVFMAIGSALLAARRNLAGTASNAAQRR